MIKILLVLIMLLSPKQLDFIVNSTADLNIASGSIRSGKSHAVNLRLINDLEMQCKKGVDYLITGKTGSTAYINVIKPVLRLAGEMNIADRFKYVSNPDRLIYLPKKIDCWIKGANDEKAEESMRGMTVQGWIGDEVTTYPESFLKHAYGRCSAGNRFKYLTCNFENPGHFFKTDFINKIENGSLPGKVWYFDIDTDNPVLDREYIKNLKAFYTGVFYDRYIKGLWVMAEGIVYSNFNPAIHVVDEIPEIKEYFLGVDWGYDNPMAISLIGVDGDNTYYICDEIYLKGKLIPEIVAEIKGKGWPEISYFFADPSRPELIRQFYEESGIDGCPGQNDVLEGILEVSKHFQIRDNGRAGLYIHRKCQHGISEVQNYSWKHGREGISKDEVIKVNDHLLDGWRYVIYTRRNADNGPMASMSHRERNA